MAEYLIRLDDACPTMDIDKWQRVFDMLDKYSIKPIIAVVPKNEDKKLMKTPAKDDFWDMINAWQKKGYHIALHGYSHVYQTKNSGLLQINSRSEFASVPFEEQREKIKKGFQIFRDKGIETRIWVAPAHSFDENTLRVLQSETDIQIVSDGLSLLPYKKLGFVWVPSQLSKFKKRYFGVWTICLHPNEMGDKSLEKLELDIGKNVHLFRKNILQLSEMYQNRQPGVLDNCYFMLYHLKRRMLARL